MPAYRLISPGTVEEKIWELQQSKAQTIADVLASLKRARVALLIDVRAVAASRKPGFSKRLLAAGLEEQGIRYVHLQGLGTPKEGRQAVRAGRPARMEATACQPCSTARRTRY